MLRSCIKGFLRAKKLWVNPPKAERAKPSLSSDYNLLFKNKIGERSLDIHRLHGMATEHGYVDSSTDTATFVDDVEEGKDEKEGVTPAWVR